MSKLFKKLFLKRLKPLIEQRQLIAELQFGCRNYHSTVDQVHHETNVINKAMGEKKYCFEVFLNITQAFKKV